MTESVAIAQIARSRKVVSIVVDGADSNCCTRALIVVDMTIFKCKMRHSHIRGIEFQLKDIRISTSKY